MRKRVRLGLGLGLGSEMAGGLELLPRGMVNLVG